MSKTPEQMAEELADQWAKRDTNHWKDIKGAFFAGYQAARDQLADRDKVVTADYVKTASNDAKELITKYELEGDKDMLIKALVAAYCSGVDAVDGYLRNSLSAYRNSVKRLQWISVKERLPEEGEEVLVFGQYLNDIPKVLGVRSRYKGDQDWKYTWEGSDEWVYRENDVTHWMPLPTVEGLKHED